MPKVVASGAEDVAELSKIAEARPKGRDVIAEAKKHPKTKVLEDGSGKFKVLTARDDVKAASSLAHLFDDARKLEVERAHKLIGRRETIMVRNMAGQLVPIGAGSEREAGARDLIEAPTKTFTRGAPRCWQQGHDFRNGRCWWCGGVDG